MRFVKVDRPEVRPGTCIVCQGVEGPMIDTLIERMDGRIYLCKRCVGTGARELGWFDTDTVAEIKRVLVEADRKIGELETELQYERDNKVVSLQDVLAIKTSRDHGFSLLEADIGS